MPTILENDTQRIINVHNHGHVCLEDVLGDELSIVNNARVSFDDESDAIDLPEIGLLNFLMKNKHGSPWEAVVFRFDIKAPLFVIREWQRHRIGSFNEQSARYSIIPEEWYIPSVDHVRTQVGKPGAYSFETINDHKIIDWVRESIDQQCEEAFELYNGMLSNGIAKEVARSVLPVGMYSRMKWTVNLRSLLNFLELRNHEHAQREIRDYAEVVEKLAHDAIPLAIEIFNDHGRVAP